MPGARRWPRRRTADDFAFSYTPRENLDRGSVRGEAGTSATENRRAPTLPPSRHVESTSCAWACFSVASRRPANGSAIILGSVHAKTKSRTFRGPGELAFQGGFLADYTFVDNRKIRF